MTTRPGNTIAATAAVRSPGDKGKHTMNASREKGIGRLRNLRDFAEATALEMSDHAERFGRLAQPGSAPRVVSSFNLFQTPEPLAERLAGMFPTFGRTLEPSAGLGRLYRAVRYRSNCEAVLVDVSPDCCAELERIADERAKVIQGDFLTMAGLGLFDCIIMNPPFKNGQDVKHIQHALTMLDDGGLLVALCAAGPRQRAALEPKAAQWIDLPEGSFRSEGTNVNAAIVVFEK